MFNPDNTAHINYRPIAVETLVAEEVVIQGPRCIFGSKDCSSSYSTSLALIARLPIFAYSDAINDTWADVPWPGYDPGTTIGPFNNVTNCTVIPSPINPTLDRCNTNGTFIGKRFWGFTVS